MGKPKTNIKKGKSVVGGSSDDGRVESVPFDWTHAKRATTLNSEPSQLPIDDVIANRRCKIENAELLMATNGEKRKQVSGKL